MRYRERPSARRHAPAERRQGFPDARAQLVERLATCGRVETRRRRRTFGKGRIPFDDLRPRKALPCAETQLAPTRIALEDESAAGEDEFGSFARASEIARHRTIETLARQHDQATVVPTMIIGFTDSHYFRQKKIVSYGFIPIEIASGEGKGVHGINERIGVKELADGIQRMVELLKIFGGQ